MKDPVKILIITEDQGLKKVLDFCFRGWGYDVFFDDHPVPDIAKIMRVLPDVIVVDIHSDTEACLKICGVLKSNFVTIHVPVITLIDRLRFRRELLDLRHGVDDYLVKPPDPLDLRIRVEMAIKRSRQNLYANPLTGLPGGIIIEEVIKERIENGLPFAAGHVDVDNFKSFNDRYGYLKGDRVIMQTAYMLATAVRSWGAPDDFVGHIGGDDFIFVTGLDKYKPISENFICMFDTVTPFHYSDDVREKKFLMSRARSNKLMKLPLMSVTIALIVRNNREEFKNIIELNERMAEVKGYLKKMPGSKYMADRRILKKDASLTLQLFANDESIEKHYKPLGQILLERKSISAEDLDTALKIHWKGASPLGEVLKERGLISEEELSRALAFQGNDLSFQKTGL